MPQIVVGFVLFLQVVGGLVLDGEPLSNPNYDGAWMIRQALFMAILLWCGGFWK